jgi:signal transduction histidine kinase
MQSDRRALQAENERLGEELRKAQERISALTVLQEMSGILTAELQLEPLLNEILRSAVLMMNASAGALILLDPETDELVFSVIEGGSGEALLERRLKKDEGIAGWVVTHGRPVIVNDVSQDDRWYGEVEESIDFSTTSLICVPLTYKGSVIGALQILNKLSGEEFDEVDLDPLTTLAHQSATAIENARLYQSLRGERDRIVAIEEEVRKELAHDLHDGPVQLLSVIVMQLQFVRELVERTPEALTVELGDMETIASKALHQLRSMLFDLRPVVLETEGLIPAIRAYVELIRKEKEIAVHLNVMEPEERLSKRMEKTLFSIIQEAVANIRKHARAENIWISIIPREDQLLVAARDDGRGFDLAQVERSYGKRGSLGLLHMRERAELLGAELTIDSQTGKGTTVTLVVPLPSEGTA